MKIAFQTNTLCHRGTTVAVADYAKFNQELLGNESIILYNKSFSDPGISHDSHTQPDVLGSLTKNFDVIGYSSLEELNKICNKNNIDAAYFIKAGSNDGLYTDCTKNLIHAVFQQYQPHGDKYAYVSEWLSNVMSNNIIPFVPHIVELPKIQNKNFRDKLGISKDKIVIGRYGGLYQFDLQFVMRAIFDIVTKDNSFVFVFVNTYKFINHPNVIFLDPIINLQEKTDFILSCDAMIHARSGGESFGLAICEFLYHNKPVFAWEDGIDKHHITILKGTNTLYNENNITDKILQLKDKESFVLDYHKLVEKFSSVNVMTKFNEVFLK